jgi:HD-GYP domain-containing protein (c-di-GMP phosphodiesterase class II)
MVRFSNFITLKDKKKFGIKPLETAFSGEDGGARDSQITGTLTDNQISRLRGGKGTPASSAIEESSSNVITYYEKFVKRATNIRDRVRINQGINPSPILSDLHYILNENLEDKLYGYAIYAPGDYEPMAVHNVEVTFISLMVGRAMNYNLRTLLGLGLAAFLENVGMYRIPESVLQKKGKLGDKEMAMVREHPKSSYEILARMGERYQWLAEVAFQVHERSDGSGYPHGLSAAEIYELSSIISLIDVYVAMVNDRPHREKFQQMDAVKFIIEEGVGLFPAKIRKAFLKQIPLFPVDTYVKQNKKPMERASALRMGARAKPIPLKRHDIECYDLESGEEESIPMTNKAIKTGKIKKKIVRWQASASLNVSNYRLYWSKRGGVNYDSYHIDLGNVTKVILPDDVPSFPLESADFTLGVSAVNTAGNESHITEITAHFNFAVPGPPKNLEVEDI